MKPSPDHEMVSKGFTTSIISINLLYSHSPKLPKQSALRLKQYLALEFSKIHAPASASTIVLQQNFLLPTNVELKGDLKKMIGLPLLPPPL